MKKEDYFHYEPIPPLPPLKEPYGFSIVGAAHSHIFDMARQLMAAGATLRSFYDADPINSATLQKQFPGIPAAKEAEQIYEDPSVRLIITAAIPSERAEIAIRALRSGKDCMSDKAPLTTLEQLENLKNAIRTTGRKYAVYYGESVGSEAALYACDLVRRGAIGRLCYVHGAAPHRLNAPTRPAWFFDRNQTGGVLIDLLCHQLHQFLLLLETQGLSTDIRLTSSRAGNLFHSELGDMQDYGDATFTAPCGVCGYFHVDWNSPVGLPTWGDSRMVIGGEDGMIELRKNWDITRSSSGNHVFLVNRDGEFYDNVSGKIPLTFFSRFIRESVEGFTDPLQQKLELDAIALAIRAQNAAEELKTIKETVQ